MRNNYFYLCLIFILGIFFLGCGKEINNPYSKTRETNASVTKKEQIELTISAASSLKEAMEDIEPLFKKEMPNITLTFNFASSGSLQQQIEQGAPSDIFISAGKTQMNTLDNKNLLLKNTHKDLIKNSLVLIGNSNTTVTSLNDLEKTFVEQIAIGEPSSVPAGKYADEVLINSEIKDKVSSKLVFAKDVKEVLAWTTSSNADVGFVYLSDTMSNNSVKIIEKISDNLHSPIIYPIGIIKSSKNPNEAKAFEDFLFTKPCNDIFEKYGYEIIK